MLNFIYGLVAMILVVIVFSKIRSWIVKKSIKQLRTSTASIGRSFPISEYQSGDRFDIKKFLGSVFNIFDLKLWAKSITFFVRYFIIISLIAGGVFGYGYWQGQQGKPVFVNLDYEEAVEIKVPGTDLRLFKPKNSNELYWIDSKGNKTNVKLADLPSLQKALKPYGLIFEPYAITGLGVGDTVDWESGAGAYVLKYYAWRLGGHLTNYGIYVGTGYKLSGIGLDNTALNISYGRGWSGESRFLIGVTVSF
jgi:hypothetical protein